MSSNRIQGMAETCAATGNPAMYCVEPEVTSPHSNSNGQSRDRSPLSSRSSQLNLGGPPPVDQEPAIQKRPDTATFDIVKATQYGAIERVQELVLYYFIRFLFYLKMLPRTPLY